MGTEPAAGGTATASRNRAVLPERYDDLGPIARGGWGEVRRVRDRVLDRVVVVKILAWEHLDSPHTLGRFLNEATITASLEHPGIVPVHDRGVLEDGRPWFTMKEVRGETLTASLATSTSEIDPGVRLRRLIEILARVAETLGFAHRRAVIHRDIKPSNIMVGDLGEVLVLDWGIARRDGETLTGQYGRPDSGTLDTAPGEILGTVAYMSPEQARGLHGLVGPASDVFSIGLVLFEVLEARRARSSERVRAWVEAAAGTRVELDASVPDVPEDLREIYARCVAPNRADRYADGGVLASALRGWLDGVARRERAARAIEEACRHGARADELRKSRDALRTRAALLLASATPDDDVGTRLAAWDLEDEASDADRMLALEEARRTTSLETALGHDAGNAVAHAELASIYRTRVVDAEARGAVAEAASLETLLRYHDRGEHQRFLTGNGRLELDTAPSGALVEVRRVSEKGRRLVEGDIAFRGVTPFGVDVPAGSYLVCIFSVAGETRYPVQIARDERWDTVRPGGGGPTRVRLLAAGSDEIHIPAGFTIVGGDALAAEPVPKAKVWVDDFWIMRFPVTCAAYLEFLNEQEASGRHEVAIRHAPRWPRGAHAEEPMAVLQRDGVFQMAPDEHGRDVPSDWPVQSIDWHSARAYAQWLAERTGSAWRLPNELEWEKAARGCDRRAYPWGAQPEPTWARMLGSTQDAPCRASVDSYPYDVSPYGVRGLAGNVRDWCANVWALDGPAPENGLLVIAPDDPDDPLPRTIKGGAWNSVPAYARAAGRFATRPDERFSAVGFRLVRSAHPG